ncbi:pseudouridine synthase [Alkalicoccus halolimnae]|uniref:Pseudouridine synthase n=1 Tax=Alkalicoccus halolimnae TaxID=1667239 RepID=A0A5C7FDB0_9BACI|nr:pseudouridine synthase [Alkalicoccus halolimnae]TXF83042.1 rRNA pseudouridine synthase [Alkalicoccus halolimnae]
MERLQKIIAGAGITSRRKAEKLIEDGKVSVNGTIVKELGAKADVNSDEIVVDGMPLEKEEPVYYLLYKPSGVISSVKDEAGRKVVTDYLPTEKRIYPVGRLDFDTSGVLIMTNDGEFANMLMHPKYKVEKTYFAKVEGIPDKQKLQKLSRGIYLDGVKTAPAFVKLRKSENKKGTSIIELVIHEGRNRQVRRMLEEVGHPVLKLKRERYGILDLKGLNAGEYRELKPHEVKKLRELSVT